ncbi:MAG TPA: hypothetical protein VKX17_20060 [Planctomycetota bacterium]|nr:hypothetical protein [Planctomycetota bacterium]
MSKSTSMTRVGLLAVLLAMLGFSYSLATSNSEDAAGESVAARAVGTNPPLNFANPFVGGVVGNDRDLGDAVAGSALTRLVRAKGGIAPYTFTAAGTAVQGIPPVATTLSVAQLQLLSDGILTQVGTQCSPAIKAGPFRFQVTVKDSFGTAPHTKTETFRLTFIGSTQFRFASTTLSDGVQFRPYSDVAATINGKGPIKYKLVSSIPTSMGLGVAADGAVFGVPTVSGTVTLVVSATDANGKLAANRLGVGTNQTYTLNVTAGKSLSSLISASSITIKSGFGTDSKGVGKDGVAFKGIADLGAEAITTLSGKNLNIRIGAYTGPVASFDGKGNANTAKGVTPTVKASVKKFGLTTITITKDTVIPATLTGLTTIQLPVEVRLGDAVIGSEFLTFSIKTGKTGATLTYKGDVTNDSAGSAQLLKVVGADDKAGTGDAWKVTFLGRFPSSVLGSPVSATVAIGSNFTNTVQLTNKNGKLTGKGSNKSPVVSAFSLDTTKKGAGSYTTGVLPSSATTGTGIPQASTAPTTQVFFASTVTFSTGAGFDGSLAIFPKGKKWGSQ